MNVYDTANRLATELKQSEEYMNYKMAREALALNPDLKKRIGEFEMARYDAQLTEMQTGKEDEEKSNKMKNLYAELIQIEDAKKYFDAEMKFNQYEKEIHTQIKQLLAFNIDDSLIKQLQETNSELKAQLLT